MLGEVWAMDYDGERVLVVEVGRKHTFYSNETVEYVNVIDSRGKKHSFAKRYFLTIAKPIGQKMSETIKKTS
tara:strand:+ start:9243 stop:9458 length:216 start_codon:yes stop_codon:yes gene_type:complete